MPLFSKARHLSDSVFCALETGMSGLERHCIALGGVHLCYWLLNMSLLNLHRQTDRCTHAHTHARTHTCTHARTHTRAHAHAHAHTHTHKHTHTHTHARTHTHTHTHTHTGMEYLYPVTSIFLLRIVGHGSHVYIMGSRDHDLEVWNKLNGDY